MIATFFPNEWETYVPAEMMVRMSWSELVDCLTTFVCVPKKEHTEMYNLWEFRQIDNSVHRCKEDCIQLHGLVIDYDANLSLNDALIQFYGFECVIYTTYNHSELKDKYRVVLPFTTPMPVEEFNKKRESMIAAFPGCDRASFSRSQAIFLHSGLDKSKAFSCHLTGEFLDWTIFTDKEIVEPVVAEYQSPLTDNQQLAYKDKIMHALLSCKGFRHLDSLNIVILLKSCGGTFEDYCNIVAVCGDADSTIQQSKAKVEAWTAVPNDVKIGRIKRDNFIKKFGGTIATTTTKSTSSEIMQRVIQKYGTGVKS